MQPYQLDKVTISYYQMFDDAVDDESIKLIRNIKTPEELENIEDEISAGLYDCVINAMNFYD